MSAVSGLERKFEDSLSLGAEAGRHLHRDSWQKLLSQIGSGEISQNQKINGAERDLVAFCI